MTDFFEVTGSIGWLRFAILNIWFDAEINNFLISAASLNFFFLLGGWGVKFSMTIGLEDVTICYNYSYVGRGGGNTLI